MSGEDYVQKVKQMQQNGEDIIRDFLAQSNRSYSKTSLFDDIDHPKCVVAHHDDDFSRKTPVSFAVATARQSDIEKMAQLVEFHKQQSGILEDKLANLQMAANKDKISSEKSIHAMKSEIIKLQQVADSQLHFKESDLAKKEVALERLRDKLAVSESQSRETMSRLCDYEKRESQLSGQVEVFESCFRKIKSFLRNIEKKIGPSSASRRSSMEDFDDFQSAPMICHNLELGLLDLLDVIEKREATIDRLEAKLNDAMLDSENKTIEVKNEFQQKISKLSFEHEKEWSIKEQRVASLYEQLQTASGQLESVKNDFCEQLKLKQETIDDLRENLQKSQEKFKRDKIELIEKHRLLEGQLSQIQADRLDIMKELNTAQDKARVAEMEVQDYKSRFVHMDKDLEYKQTDLLKALKAEEKATSRLHKVQEELERQIEDCAEYKRMLSRDRMAHDELVKSMKNEAATMEETLTKDCKNQVEILKKQIALLDKDKNMMEDDMMKSKQKVNLLKTREAAATEQITELSDALEAEKLQLVQAKEVNESIGQEREQLYKLLEKCTCDMSTLEKTVEQSKVRIVQLEADLQDKTTETNAVLDQMDAMTTGMKALETKLSMTTKDLELRQAEAQRDAAKIHDFEVKTNDLSQAKTELENKLEEVQKAKMECECKFQDAKDALIAETRALREAGQTIHRLQSERASLLEQLGQTEKALARKLVVISSTSKQQFEGGRDSCSTPKKASAKIESESPTKFKTTKIKAEAITTTPNPKTDSSVTSGLHSNSDENGTIVGCAAGTEESDASMNKLVRELERLRAKVESAATSGPTTEPRTKSRQTASPSEWCDLASDAAKRNYVANQIVREVRSLIAATPIIPSAQTEEDQSKATQTKSKHRSTKKSTGKNEKEMIYASSSEFSDCPKATHRSRKHRKSSKPKTHHA